MYSSEKEREGFNGSSSKGQSHTRWQCRLSAGAFGHKQEAKNSPVESNNRRNWTPTDNSAPLTLLKFWSCDSLSIVCRIIQWSNANYSHGLMFISHWSPFVSILSGSGFSVGILWRKSRGPGCRQSVPQRPQTSCNVFVRTSGLSVPRVNATSLHCLVCHPRVPAISSIVLMLEEPFSRLHLYQKPKTRYILKLETR